jgi:hypothetical protein
MKKAYSFKLSKVACQAFIVVGFGGNRALLKNNQQNSQQLLWQ